MSKAKVAYKRAVHIREVLVHPQNRSGLGVNPHNVHETLSTIKSTGCDKEHLKKATAFEMAPVGANRDAQLNFNHKLVENSEGLMAGVSGDERLLSVACSHFTAGCRASQAGCITHEPLLQDPNGRINVIQLCQNDEVMADVLQNGYGWVILPWICDVIFPELAELAQQALNSEHTTFPMASELQVMSSMAATAARADGAPDWKAVVSQARSAQPPCKEYLESLADFVKDFSGGVGAPIIRCMCDLSIE